jgi:hypothetical protein
VRLAEVGDLGQGRLGAALVRLAGKGTEAAVEARYLRGAGVGIEEVARDAVHVPPARPAAFETLHPAAREVALGAYAALDAIRAVLSGTPHPRVHTSR